MTIHKEGITTLVLTTIFLFFLNGVVWRYSGVTTVTYVVLSISVIVFVLILQFFRKPRRVVLNNDNSIVLAPADGKVVVIEDTIETEFFEDERLMISIFMSPINVHSNHHPVSGIIEYSKYHPGKYLVAWHPKSSTENERHTVVYNMDGTKILIRQIAGALARRIVNYAKVNDKVNRGDELGFIKFGSRVDIYLPIGTKYNVAIGQKVKAKIDVIAEL